MQLSQYSQYELLSYIDPQFPVIFHHDILSPDEAPYMLHWHDAIEILYLTSGHCNIINNGSVFLAKPQDIVVFHSKSLHTTYSSDSSCEYDCLIIDNHLCSQFGVPPDDMHVTPIIKDPSVIHFYQNIKKELELELPYYKAAVKGLISELFVCLCRNHATENDGSDMTLGNKLNMVRASILFIKENYKYPLTVDQICRQAGFSKYYLCRNFKEITGYTVIEYLNIVRCTQAKLLLSTGNYTVSQAAHLCQFNHLSYFSKTYQKYMGALPHTCRPGNS